MPEGAVFVLNQQKRGVGREGTQVNHRGAVLYSEGLLRKSLQLRKTWRLVCLGAGVGTEGASALQWSHSWGRGLGSRAGQSGWRRRHLSLLPRDHAKRRACRGDHERQGWRGATGGSRVRDRGLRRWEPSGEGPGWGGQVSTHPSKRVKGAERKLGP